ncbi:MAG: hypothetical protein BGO27_04890 [Alphaproteobacteria bacterium 33-17]|nr:MAG: hypothetical protein BGO27_04890 [Alphaproteobacteria bacterium 33-17]
MTKENRLYLLMLFALIINLIACYILKKYDFSNVPTYTYIQVGYFFILNSLGAVYIKKLTKKTLAYEKTLNINSKQPKISEFLAHMPFFLIILPHLISTAYALIISIPHLISFDIIQFFSTLIGFFSLSYYFFGVGCSYHYLPAFYTCVLILAHTWYWDNYCNVSIENYKKKHPDKKPTLSIASKRILLYTLSFWILFLTPLFLIYGK